MANTGTPPFPPKAVNQFWNNGFAKSVKKILRNNDISAELSVVKSTEAGSFESLNINGLEKGNWNIAQTLIATFVRDAQFPVTVPKKAIQEGSDKKWTISLGIHVKSFTKFYKTKDENAAKKAEEVVANLSKGTHLYLSELSEFKAFVRVIGLAPKKYFSGPIKPARLTTPGVIRLSLRDTKYGPVITSALKDFFKTEVAGKSVLVYLTKDFVVQTSVPDKKVFELRDQITAQTNKIDGDSPKKVEAKPGADKKTSPAKAAPKKAVGKRGRPAKKAEVKKVGSKAKTTSTPKKKEANTTKKNVLGDSLVTTVKSLDRETRDYIVSKLKGSGPSEAEIEKLIADTKKDFKNKLSKEGFVLVKAKDLKIKTYTFEELDV